MNFITPKMTDVIAEQIFAVRDTGKVNLFSPADVLEVARDLKFRDLVTFLSDRINYKEYISFVIMRT